MFLADYHTHSLCSFDGSAPLTELAQAALEAGLSELCLTDHCDLLNTQGKPDLSFRWEPVEKQLSQARALYSDKLAIRTGVELGGAWEFPDFCRELVSHPELDLVLGSVHNLSLADGGLDFYYVNYKSEEDCYYVLDRYFDCMERLAEMDCWDVLAHVIYPLRYMNKRDGQQASLERYEPQLRRIFRRVIDSGRGLEVNTCRGETIRDWRWTLELYRDCGGELLTLGSDAHLSRDVGKGIREAAELVKELGFRSVARYIGRKPELVSLAEGTKGQIKI